MSQRQRHPGVRLGIDREAEALLIAWGEKAHEIACRRAEEASSDELISDWSDVADMIARRTGKRTSIISYMFN